MSENQKTIYAGRCLINTEAVVIAGKVQTYRAPYAGVRIMQPSSGGGDEHYMPPSDVYLHLEVKDVQALAAYFSKLARLIRGVEA